MAISIVNLAWRWSRAEDGTLSKVRIAVGAVAPTVIRAERAEQELEGRRPTPEVVSSAVTALRDAVTPIDDVRGTAAYRRHALGVIAQRALERCLA